MRKLMIGLATVALLATGCGKNNESNNATNNDSNNTTGNNTTGNNTTGNNTTGNNTTGNNTTGNNTTGNNTTGNNTTGNNTTGNNTTGTNNNTTGTNNNTTGTNNNTTGTNNNTTGPSAECQRYCDVFQANCANHATVYADEAACLTACEGFSDDAATDCSPDPTPATCAADIDGVECRIYHAGAAGMDADTHCPHASEGGGGLCDP